MNGVARMANASNPSIPAALQPVVAGVISLTDFRARAKHKARRQYTGHNACNGITCYLVTPIDLATIYSFKPLVEQGITGLGETIAVVEDSNLYDKNDWTNFRALFGLSQYQSGSLKVVHPAPIGGKVCDNPHDNSDDDEATGQRRGARRQYSGSDVQSLGNDDGVHLAIENLVNSENPPPIISISYGACETSMPETLRIAFYYLYQQAVAKGISVFVASGDTGPESCVGNESPPYVPSQATGNGVDGWVSTPYDVAVGGTDFGDTYAKTAKTSSAKTDWGSAKSYIPEIPWNDTWGDPKKWAGPQDGIQNGGTSFAAPIVAGIQALINQKMNEKPRAIPITSRSPRKIPFPRGLQIRFKESL